MRFVDCSLLIFWIGQALRQKSHNQSIPLDNPILGLQLQYIYHLVTLDFSRGLKATHLLTSNILPEVCIRKWYRCKPLEGC
jgi:hypothetical protein